jgi:glucokinase
MKVLALDIGGSSVKQAIIVATSTGGQIHSPLPTARLASRDFSDLRTLIFSLIQSVANDHPEALEHVAICTTGPVDRDGVVLNARHFKGYTNIKWATLIRQEFDNVQTVYVVNDGRSSTWAEYYGQSTYRSLVHFVVGTGVGGGLVIDRRLVLGEHGLSGILGHIKVELRGKVECSCGEFGCVETLAAAPAVVRAYNEASRSQLSSLWEVENAARDGDTDAMEALKTAGYWLGLAISYVMNTLGPGIVTIGGGLSECSLSLAPPDSGGPYIDAAIASAKRYAHRRVSSVIEISPARYGNNGGLLGAALLARASLLGE